MNQLSVTSFAGSAFSVEKRNIRKGEVVTFPEGSVLLASEIVMDGTESVVEIWLAVPFQTSAVNIPVMEPSKSVEEWPGLAEALAASDITVEIEDENE